MWTRICELYPSSHILVNIFLWKPLKHIKTYKNTYEHIYFKNIIKTQINKKRPAGGSAANEGRTYFQKTNIFEKRPAGGSAANEWKAYYPVIYCRLPRDLLSITPRPISITPRPIIDYPVPYYRLHRDLLSISPEKEMPQVLLN